MDGDLEAGERFLALARAYCEVVEAAPTLALDALVDRLRTTLAQVVAAALELPDVEPVEEDITTSIDHAAWVERYRALARALGSAESYWTVEDPFDPDEPSALSLSLADDLADIWRDLNEPLLALDAGLTLDDAVWEWRFGFHTHWGSHAVEALRALHRAVGLSPRTVTFP